MSDIYLERGAKAPVYLLSTHEDIERRIMSVLAAEIDEGGRELALRCGNVSLEVARCYLIRTVAQHLVLNMMVLGKDKDIEKTALYMARRARYGVQSGQYTEGDVLHGKETSGDRSQGVPEMRMGLVASDGGLPDEVR